MSRGMLRPSLACNQSLECSAGNTLSDPPEIIKFIQTDLVQNASKISNHVTSLRVEKCFDIKMFGNQFGSVTKDYKIVGYEETTYLEPSQA